jgi:hypothetical protein
VLQEVLETLKMIRAKTHERMRRDGFLEHDEDFYAQQVLCLEPHSMPCSVGPEAP